MKGFVRGLLERFDEVDSDKKMMVDTIIQAEKSGIGLHTAEDRAFDDLMEPTWGIRGNWELKAEGPFSHDAGEQFTWEEEREQLASDPSENGPEPENLRKAYEAAKKILAGKREGRRTEAR